MGDSGSGGQLRASSPAFLRVDERAPLSVRELLAEADGCIANGFLTGGTACVQRAIEMVLKLDKADGAAYDVRIRALSDRHPSMPQLLVTILLQFGDAGGREPIKLAPNNLELLIAALKAVVHEIYVIGPERGERLQYIRRILETADRKTLSLSDLASPSGAVTSSLETPPAKPPAKPPVPPVSKAPAMASTEPLAASRPS